MNQATLACRSDAGSESANPAEPFLGWPGWSHVGQAVALGLLVSAWWLLIFHGANHLTRYLPHRVCLHCDAELAIPFVPASVLGYMSIYPLFWMSPFVLRRGDELGRLAWTLAAITLLAGACFLLFPGDPHFRTPAEQGIWSPLIGFAKALALEHNFAPSLHVGLAVVCIAVYARRAPLWGRGVLWAWSLLVAASTLLLHQHYLIDVLTGYALGWGGVRVVYDRGRGAETAPPSPCRHRVPPA